MQSIAEALKSPRAALWETPFCHSVRRRVELMGEPEDLARLRHDRCSELTALCSTTSYEACHAEVTEHFVTHAGSD